MNNVFEIYEENEKLEGLSRLEMIELEMAQMGQSLKTGWLVIGLNTLEIKNERLFVECHRSFTAWIKYMSDKLHVQPSALWKYLKVVEMLVDLNYSIMKVDLQSLSKLEQIARIYGLGVSETTIIGLMQRVEEHSVSILELKVEFRTRQAELSKSGYIIKQSCYVNKPNEKTTFSRSKVLIGIGVLAGLSVPLTYAVLTLGHAYAG